MKHFFQTVILIFVVMANLKAQSKFWLFLDDRDVKSIIQISSKTMDNRRSLGLARIQESDYLPNEKVVDRLKSANIHIIQSSKWLNAVSVNYQDMLKAKNIEGVQGIREISSMVLAKNSMDENYYLPFVLQQINGNALIDRYLFGEGIDIGVIDGGFYNANKLNLLDGLFANSLIKNTKDFVNPSKLDFFNSRESDSDIHGTFVLTAIAGHNAEVNNYTGLASQSNFYLARTESGKKEARVEEDNYLAAIEWMDSLGVRLINSSLGYAQGFTNPAENYQPENMDGKTSVIAKAAQIAVQDKGMILVVSAGNDGENAEWGGVVGTPADVEGVISVGANDAEGKKMDYSSKGVEFVTFTKPDLTVYSTFGTSFAAPTITGLVASLMELKPEISNAEIKQILKTSASIFPYENNYVGAGIPDARKCVAMLNNLFKLEKNKVKKAKRSFKIVAKQSLPILVFHKKDKTHVLYQELIPASQKILNQPINVKYSTLKFEDKLIEIQWK